MTVKDLILFSDQEMPFGIFFLFLWFLFELFLIALEASWVRDSPDFWKSKMHHLMCFMFVSVGLPGLALLCGLWLMVKLMPDTRFPAIAWPCVIAAAVVSTAVVLVPTNSSIRAPLVGVSVINSLVVVGGTMALVFCFSRGGVDADDATCAHRLKEIGLAISMYKEDHDGNMPPGNACRDVWVKSLSTYMGGHRPECPFSFRGAPSSLGWWQSISVRSASGGSPTDGWFRYSYQTLSPRPRGNGAIIACLHAPWRIFPARVIELRADNSVVVRLLP